VDDAGVVSALGTHHETSFYGGLYYMTMETLQPRQEKITELTSAFSSVVKRLTMEMKDHHPMSLSLLLLLLLPHPSMKESSLESHTRAMSSWRYPIDNHRLIRVKPFPFSLLLLPLPLFLCVCCS
jgi:hypothetical protein